MKREEFYLYKSEYEMYVNQVIYDPIKFMEWINEASLRLGATFKDVDDPKPFTPYRVNPSERVAKSIKGFHCFEYDYDTLGYPKIGWTPGIVIVYKDPIINQKFLALSYRISFLHVERFCFAHLYEYLYQECIFRFLFKNSEPEHPEYLEVVKEYLNQFQFIETQKVVDYTLVEPQKYQLFHYKHKISQANQKILSLRDIN